MDIRSHLPALFAGAVAGAVAGAIIPAARTATAETGVVHDEGVTRRLVVVDAAGKQRAVIAAPAAPDGVDLGVGLVLTDATGKLRASLGVAFSGPHLSLYDSAGSTLAELP